MLIILKRNVSRTFKSSSCKKSFPSINIINTTCFDECFLFLVITGRHYCYTNLLLNRGLVQLPCYWILWNTFFQKKSAFYINYLHNNITANTEGPQQRFYFLNLLITFFFLILSVCECFTSSFMHKIFRTQKLKRSLEACFLLRAIVKFLWGNICLGKLFQISENKNTKHLEHLTPIC